MRRFAGNFREGFTQDSFNTKQLTCNFFQVKNLPIKSPKVPTLKKALKRFHQTQKGKSSKPLATKVLEEASLKEDTGNKEGKISHVFHSRFHVVLFQRLEFDVKLTNRRQFSMVYTLIDHKMTSNNVQNSSGTTCRRRVVSLPSFGHFMASFYGL